MRTNGRWDDPRYWRRPEYKAVSPYSDDELTTAFQAARMIYPPEVVKQTFASEEMPWLASLLIDPWRPDLSGLLALGLDAAHARIERYPGLVQQLRRSDAYPGARLEVAVLAALEREHFRYEYEPFAQESRKRARQGESFPNPDLRVELGAPVIIDIKKMQTSKRADRRLKRFMLILYGSKDHWEPIPAAIELTAQYDRIEKSGYSEDRLDRLAVKLHALAVQKAVEMQADGITTATIGGGLLKLNTAHRHSLGVPLNDPRDANRIVAKLDEGASQIPRNEAGLIIVEPSDGDHLQMVTSIAREWLELAKPEIFGLVLLADQWVTDAPHSLRIPLPIWRASTPSKIRKGKHWRRFAKGINWRWFRARQSWTRKSAG